MLVFVQVKKYNSSHVLLFYLQCLQQDLSPLEKQRLVRLCNGHPYALHLVGKLSKQDYSNTAERSRTTATDVSQEINNTELLERLFAKTFDEECNKFEGMKDLLFAVVVFDQGASLSALHYVRILTRCLSPYKKHAFTIFSAFESFALQCYSWLTLSSFLLKKIYYFRVTATVFFPSV